MYYFPKDDFYPVRLFKLALPDPCDFINNNNERSYFWHHNLPYDPWTGAQ